MGGACVRDGSASNACQGLVLRADAVDAALLEHDRPRQRAGELLGGGGLEAECSHRLTSTDHHSTTSGDSSSVKVATNTTIRAVTTSLAPLFWSLTAIPTKNPIAPQQ